MGMAKKKREDAQAKAIYEDWGVEPTVSAEGQASRLSPGQRFLLALLFFLIVLVIGLSCLVLTGKIWLA